MIGARLRPDAANDISAAYDWYESQRSGLGPRFVAAVDAAIGAIIEHPEAHPIVQRGTRRALLERFPYGLYYRVTPNELLIIACLHAARDPKAWQSRSDG